MSSVMALSFVEWNCLLKNCTHNLFRDYPRHMRHPGYNNLDSTSHSPSASSSMTEPITETHNIIISKCQGSHDRRTSFFFLFFVCFVSFPVHDSLEVVIFYFSAGATRAGNITDKRAGEWAVLESLSFVVWEITYNPILSRRIQIHAIVRETSNIS